MMNNKVFLDSNILIYLYSKDEPKKREIASDLLAKFDNVYISTQVLFEFTHIMHRKLKVDYDQIDDALKEFNNAFLITNVTYEIIRKAIKIAEKYKYSFVDSLIIATAINSNCDILYSEDMHADQVIENSLKIANPFK